MYKRALRGAIEVVGHLGADRHDTANSQDMYALISAWRDVIILITRRLKRLPFGAATMIMLPKFV